MILIYLSPVHLVRSRKHSPSITTLIYMLHTTTDPTAQRPPQLDKIRHLRDITDAETELNSLTAKLDESC